MNYKSLLKSWLLTAITLTFCLFYISCNSSIFNSFHKRKIGLHTVNDIKLIGFKDSLNISYEIDSAKIIIGLNEAIRSLDRIAKGESLDKRIKGEINKAIIFLANSKSNVIIVDCGKRGNKVDHNLCDLWNTIDREILREILLKGGAHIFNKKTNNFESRILIIHDKFTTVDELHEYYSFQFINGSEFYLQIIAI